MSEPTAPESPSTGAADRPSTVPWPPILLGAAIVGAIVLGRAAPLPWTGLDDWPARAIGLGFGGVGLALILWAGWTMRQARTTVMPHRASDALVTSGPFRRFRNPIYLGDAMILLGLAELTKNVWFVLAALLFGVLVTWLAILPEERHLEARFGDAYRAYKARSRRWL